jgi:uncharacterized OB-fold protein
MMENLLEEPSRGGVQAAYQASLNAGNFIIQRCTHCKVHVFFPREFCPHCSQTGLVWIKPSGEGIVYAVTTVRRKAEMGGDYNVSLVDLAEGVRMMSQVENVPLDRVEIGLRVRARVTVRDGQGLVVFDAVEHQGALV